MDATEVGKRVLYFRQQKGLSKNALANRAGVSPTCINDIESGKKCPTVETLGYICDFGFEISLTEFFKANLYDNNDMIATLNDNQREALNIFIKSLTNK